MSRRHEADTGRSERRIFSNPFEIASVAYLEAIKDLPGTTELIGNVNEARGQAAIVRAADIAEFRQWHETRVLDHGFRYEERRAIEGAVEKLKSLYEMEKLRLGGLKLIRAAREALVSSEELEIPEVSQEEIEERLRKKRKIGVTLNELLAYESEIQERARARVEESLAEMHRT